MVLRTSGLRAAVDTETEEGRSFLQERLALFAKWFFLVAVIFYVIANLPLPWVLGMRFDWVEEWFGTKELLTLGVIAVAGAVWIGSRGRSRPAGQLRALEAAGVAIPCALMAVMLVDVVLANRNVQDVYLMLLATTNVVTVRAIVVPSTPRRTLALSALSLTPVVALTAVTVLVVEGLPTLVVAHLTVGSLLWVIIAVASATMTSRILFQLRQEV